MPLVSQRKVCAIKIETTPGTAESLTSSEVIPVVDIQFTPQVGLVERPRNGAFGLHSSAVSNFSGTATITVECAGKGSSGTPAWADLFKACGMSETSGVYSFSSVATDQKTITIGGYHDGLFVRLCGCMGDFVFTSTSGDKPVVVFTMQGVWAASVTDVAMLTPATPVTPPNVRSAVVTFDSFHH